MGMTITSIALTIKLSLAGYAPPYKPLPPPDKPFDKRSQPSKIRKALLTLGD